MAIQIQLRQGTTTEHSTFTGAVGEVTVDTTKNTLVVHDGVTKGGFPLLSIKAQNSKITEYFPLPCPLYYAPEGYLIMMGQTISQSMYPILYSLYGATLPDMRAYTIRGLDSNRGIDLGRDVLSTQQDAIRNITGRTPGGSIDKIPATSYTGAFQRSEDWAGSVSSGENFGVKISTFDASRVVPTASENRVKNIAFLYIVKAG